MVEPADHPPPREEDGPESADANYPALIIWKGGDAVASDDDDRDGNDRRNDT